MAERNHRRAEPAPPARGPVLAQAEDDHGSYILYDNIAVEEIVFDGFASLNVSPGMCKVKLYKSVSVEMKNGKPHETREVCATLFVPTASLVDWVLALPASLKPAMPILEATSDRMITNLKKLVGD